MEQPRKPTKATSSYLNNPPRSLEQAIQEIAERKIHNEKVNQGRGT